MKLLSTTLTALALVTLATPAFATNLCESRVNDIPDIVNVTPGKTLVLASGGPQDGWDGQAVRCTLLSGVASIAPSRDANGICGPARSIVGQGPASLKKLPDVTTIIVTPDDPEYRIGFYFNPPGPPPTVWIGTNWINGTCPGS